MEVVYTDEELMRRFVSATLINEATWCQVRCIVKQLELLRNSSVDDFTLPGDILLRAVRPGEVRICTPDGEVYLRSADGETFTLVLPQKYLMDRFCPFCVHVTDRGPIVSKCLHSMMDMDYLMLSVPFFVTHLLYSVTPSP